jgi:hypothetical protein
MFLYTEMTNTYAGNFNVVEIITASLVTQGEGFGGKWGSVGLLSTSCFILLWNRNSAEASLLARMLQRKFHSKWSTTTPSPENGHSLQNSRDTGHNQRWFIVVSERSVTRSNRRPIRNTLKLDLPVMINALFCMACGARHNVTWHPNRRATGPHAGPEWEGIRT